MNSFLQLPNCWTKSKPCSPVGNVNHDLPCVFPAEDALVRDASPELLIEEIRLEKSKNKLRWSWFLTGPSRFFWMYIIMIMLFIQGADDTALLLRDFEGEIWNALRKPSIQVEINWNSTHTPTSFPGLFSAEERAGGKALGTRLPIYNRTFS